MRYLLEIFSICSSHVCANLTKKFWPLLNQPASHGPFRPKLWMPLAIVFVEIFQKEKNWWGSGPIGVTSWKDFSISLKKWRFWFFWKACGSTLTMSTIRVSQITVLTSQTDKYLWDQTFFHYLGQKYNRKSKKFKSFQF